MGRIRCGYCILRVNMVKYQKLDTLENKDSIKFAATQMRMKTNKWCPTNQSLSFADMVHGTMVKYSENEVRNINIRLVSFSKCSHDCVMVGEAINIQIIGELPMILSLEGKHEATVHYIGCMNVIFKFVNSKMAKVFHENQQNSNRWFKLLKMRFNDDLVCERLTRVKILGLPIRFHSFENYMKIVNAFRKTIESPWTKGVESSDFDLYYGFVCVLTKTRTIINGEIDVSFGKKKYKVGVVECDRD
ncbi:unnamed protein product [Lactuca saligna]|uniref:Uncharacterized protein n=1 Tax=Lactuca saligna TaxID=75948 RepID=A0AA35YPS2_LACSI|nr:unnamed protein product [Lactuca saligna]